MKRNTLIYSLVCLLSILAMGLAGGKFLSEEIKKIRTGIASTLPVYNKVPEFSLIERSGSLVSLSDLIGKVWIANFIFTHCAGPCPFITTQMKKLQTQLVQVANVQLVSVSVDPERDSPRVLSDYSLRFGADKENWFFLTGEKAAVYRMIREGFRIAIEDDLEANQISHSLKFVLVDRAGQVRAYYDGTDPELVDKVILDLKILKG